MTTFTSTYNNTPRWFSRLVGVLCLLVMLLCNAESSYANDTENESVADEYGQPYQLARRADAQNKVTHSYTVYKKRYYIPSRRFSVEPFLKQPPVAISSHPIQLAETATRKYNSALSCPTRPSYYVLLFLYALF